VVKLSAKQSSNQPAAAQAGREWRVKSQGYASFVSLVTAVHNQMALLTIGEIYDMWLAICQRPYEDSDLDIRAFSSFFF
jgi:hypothetical protein